MTPRTLIALFGPVLTAMAVDLHSYAQQRKISPTAVFDWNLALSRWFGGLVVGIGAALGISVVQ